MKIRFRIDFDAWWPDYDHAPERNFNFLKRNLPDMDVAARMCKRKRTAVQAGGHAGFWPKRLATMFNHVHAFEAEPELFECMKLNTKGVKGLTIYPYALGDKESMVKMRPHCTAGSWRVDPEGSYEVVQTTIDRLGLTDCDAIFLDIEGYELEALKGASETIKRCRPVIMVEELPRSRDAIVSHLNLIGYKPYKAVHKDRVYVPREHKHT